MLLALVSRASASSDDNSLNYQRLLLLKNDSVKCARLMTFAEKLTDSLYDYNFSLLVYGKVNSILGKENYPTLRRDLYYKWAFSYYLNGEFEKADKLYTKALAFKMLDSTPALKAKILNRAAVNLQDLTMYKRALVYYNEALKLFSMSNDIKGKGMVYVNMANIFAFNGDYIQSDQYFDKAIKIFLQNNLIEDYGLVLGNKSYIRWKLNDLETAKTLTLRSLRLDIKKIKKFHPYLDRYLNLGLIYSEMHRWDSCFYYLNRGKVLADSLHLSDQMDGIYYYKMGYCYAQKGEPQKGIPYFKRALKFRTGIPNYRSLYDNLADLYFQLNQYDTAFMYKDASQRMSDSIYKSELKEHINFENKRIELLEKDYNNEIEAARQQQSLDDLQKRNYLLIGLVILLLAGVALLFLYFRQYRLKAKKSSCKASSIF
jgi:tetratricopeptide (TPR) repeat protein